MSFIFSTLMLNAARVPIHSEFSTFKRWSLGKNDPIGCFYAADIEMYRYPQTFPSLFTSDLYFYFTTRHKKNPTYSHAERTPALWFLSRQPLYTLGRV